MDQQNPELIVSSSPHLKSNETVRTVMLDVIIALIPAIIAAGYFFGLRALLVIGISVVACLLTEFLCLYARGRSSTLGDLSAVVTGILFAMCLPASTPFVFVFIGGAVAVGIGKQAFGGLGHNVFNPALVGRAFMLSSWPVIMTAWTRPIGINSASWLSLSDGISCATPLGMIKASPSVTEGIQMAMAGKDIVERAIMPDGISYMDMFIGRMPGSLGETSALALLIGGIYLLYRGQISWHIPTSYMGTFALLIWIFGGDTRFSGDIAYHLLCGGMFMGAFFMMTDMVTSPISAKGRILFGIGGGLIVFLIRIYGGYPEGVCYSILLMNACTPLIDRYIKPRKYGEVR